MEHLDDLRRRRAAVLRATLAELEKTPHHPVPKSRSGTDPVTRCPVTEEAWREAARVEAQANDRELLTPEAAVVLFGHSPEAVRRAVHARHVRAPFLIQTPNKPTALISLSSASEYWGKPEDPSLDRMREAADILGVDGLSYAVLYASPVGTHEVRPNTLVAKMEAALSFRWPKEGDRLIRRSRDPKTGGRFPADTDGRHVHIWDGYMRAGAILALACEEDPDECHSLIYPILSNYRHAVEVAMKWIIRMYGGYSTARIDNIEHHDLWKLWRLCRKVVTELGPDGEAIPIIEQIVKELHDLDISGQSFRYSSLKSGHLAPLPDYPIDIPNMRDVMEGVASYFDGIDAHIDASLPPSGW